MTPLRRRFIEDLTIRNYSPRTIECYVSHVARFAAYFQRSPEHLGAEEVRAFQLHLLGKRASWSVFNQTVCALRALYRLTLQQPDVVSMIPYGKKPKRLPCILSAEELVRLFAAARPGRNRVLLQTAYALGLRLSELVHLQVRDIDKDRQVVHVRQGKGAKDRLVPISNRLLQELRWWWRSHRSAVWLFPGARSQRPLSDGQVQRIFGRTRRAAGIDKPASMHTLRHSYATHLLEAGVPITVVQRLLGHSDLSTTARYLHCSLRDLQRTPSLLDLLAMPQVRANPAEGGHDEGSGRVDQAPVWRSCRPGFFLPVRVLSAVFRGKFLAGLQEASAQGALTFAGELAELQEAARFAGWVQSLRAKAWVVYAKPPFERSS